MNAGAVLFRNAFKPRWSTCTTTSKVQKQLLFTRTTTTAYTRCFASSGNVVDAQQQQQQRPFRILGVQQIAVGSTDRHALQHLWCHILGLAPIHTNVRLEKENVVEDSVASGNGVTIDLMTPIDVQNTPRVHTPPLHHVGLWIDDLVAGTQWMTAHGVRLTGPIRKGAAGYDICFIHPKGNAEFPISGNGVLIELVQAPPEMLLLPPQSQLDPSLATGVEDPTKNA